MEPAALPLIPAKSASEAAPRFAPGEEGTPRPTGSQSPLAYLEALASGGHFDAAFGFLAAALPGREAVWWACRCARIALGPALIQAAEAALTAAEVWTASPGDVNRRKAMAASEAVGFGHPAGCAGLAAFLSGGSIVPANLKEVLPPEDAFARAVVGSIALSAARLDPRAIEQTRRSFFDLGLAVARGEDRWKSPT